MVAPVGRRNGPPSATRTAAPENQPIRKLCRESKETGEARKRVTLTPTSRSQPSRRHRRSSQGAAAVRTALTTATPTADGNPGSESGPAASSNSMIVSPASGAKPSRIAVRATARRTASTTVTSSRHRPRRTVTTSPPPKKMTASTLVPITTTAASHSGRASNPLSTSEAKATRVSPNSHWMTISTRSATVATTRRNTSAGDRSVFAAGASTTTVFGSITAPRYPIACFGPGWRLGHRCPVDCRASSRGVPPWVSRSTTTAAVTPPPSPS